MNDFSFSHSYKKKNKYSAKNNIRNVRFYCLAPDAVAIQLMGDFNDWDPEAYPMKKHVDGSWTLELPLSHGAHHYLFNIDGKPTLDLRARGIARNEKNEKVSLVTVS
ncbi:MAG TPA: glycoside hydrolase family 13 [Verrucomicrobiales bacterium]|nr:glycoside hydrolase family 13 [Verrucomicrobiales bacterium]